jgi:hypothetical protein
MSYLTTYQLATGQQRSVCVEDPENLFKAFYGLIDFGVTSRSASWRVRVDYRFDTSRGRPAVRRACRRLASKSSD